MTSTADRSGPGRRAAGPALLAVRSAVRALLAEPELREAPLLVACSGGADSLALAAATAHAARDRRLSARIVDHGLQQGSADVAARAAEQLDELGFTDVAVLRVRVTGGGGPEAAARRARYAALERARPEGAAVLLGHTLDDQAETVLLGLGRGSGARSLAGMRPWDRPWARPLLGLSRETTERACAEGGLVPWRDPHNGESRFTRVRLRTEVLPLLEQVLQGGVAGALARTARQLQEDADALDEVAEAVRAQVARGADLDAAALAGHPPAVRRRVLRGWLLARGIPELSDAHLRAADALAGRWRGQGPHALPGGFVLRRRHGTLQVEPGGRATAERVSGG
ncbi:tRNA lysidine(34) synthetase TilS [Saccharopolyspora sp. MS10]|uniref:tRNA lysidine(34) synthetase TilS n=1 Tax=Saccharopolyspora sp. MS10 TaxID=3385973 RepID=UPI0039A25231